MASGARRVYYGTFVGTGATKDVKEPGFRPKYVKIWNLTGTTIAEWTETMADASMAKQVTAGDITFPTTLGITPLASGFRVGADTDLNVSGELCHFMCSE